MLIKMVRQEFARTGIITFILFIFITLSAFLLSVGSGMVIDLLDALEYTAKQSYAPDFVQLSSENVDSMTIDTWAKNNDLVKQNQTVEMLNIDSDKVYFSKFNHSEASSVMSFDFVKQNHNFDYLLDLNGNVIHLLDGQIAVPIYFMKTNHLKINDIVTIKTSNFIKKFKIVSFVRDYLMNPSIIHSKRFLINQNDFSDLKNKINSLGTLQYLIEFKLADNRTLSNFVTQYQSSHLPQKGPAITFNLMKVLNSLSDGVIIGILILLSLLLVIISLLSLRFTILISLEEDYRQLGIMKAIGISIWNIKKLYLGKYIFLGGISCLFGFIISLFLCDFFQSNILLYLGSFKKSYFHFLTSLFSSFFVFLLIISYSLLVIRKINKISAVEALKLTVVEKKSKRRKSIYINQSKFMNLNLLLSLKDIFNRLRFYALLFIIFFVCIFIIVTPINLINTLTSPNFITYLGVSKSDMRIDLQSGNNSIQYLHELKNYIKNDKDIQKYSILPTSRFRFIKSDGSIGNLNIETGNFSIFPLEYIQGFPPIFSNQIALSYLNSKSLNVNINDKIILFVDEKPTEMTITGIYQDITNGGLTSKAFLPIDYKNALWTVTNIDFKSGVDITSKIKEYNKKFTNTRVTDIKEYLSQTLGDIVNQLKYLAYLATFVGFFISTLIASLFLKMLIAKDYSQITIMRAIGFSSNQLRLQYILKSLIVLNLAIIVGVTFSNLIDQKLISFIWALMGAPKITLVINYFEVTFLIPLIFIIIMTVTTIFSTNLIKKTKITTMTVE